MKFWDASAIVPLIVSEASSRRLQALASADTAMLVWWATEVECASAVVRREREGALDAAGVTLALRRLGQLAVAWHQVDPSDTIRAAAIRFLRVHRLRAADALQLAAAFLAAGHRPDSLEIVTLDEHLAAAASKEGFAVTS